MYLRSQDIKACNILSLQIMDIKNQVIVVEISFVKGTYILKWINLAHELLYKFINPTRQTRRCVPP